MQQHACTPKKEKSVVVYLDFSLTSPLVAEYSSPHSLGSPAIVLSHPLSFYSSSFATGDDARVAPIDEAVGDLANGDDFTARPKRIRAWSVWCPRPGRRTTQRPVSFGWLVGSSSLLVLASSIDGSASSILRLCILSMSILHASPLCRRRRQLYIFVFASKIEWVIQPVSGRVNEQP